MVAAEDQGVVLENEEGLFGAGEADARPLRLTFSGRILLPLARRIARPMTSASIEESRSHARAESPARVVMSVWNRWGLPFVIGRHSNARKPGENLAAPQLPQMDQTPSPGGTAAS